jgi:hypothetical protein
MAGPPVLGEHAIREVGDGVGGAAAVGEEGWCLEGVLLQNGEECAH